MSAGLETVDNINVNLFSLRLEDRDDEPISVASTSTCVNYVGKFNEILNVTSIAPQDVQQSPQEKKKRKRVRSRKKSKNKDHNESETINTVAEIHNQNSCDVLINLSIKAVRSQNSSLVFHKRNTECQYINFEFLMRLPETYVFDSREFVKLVVLNESVVDIDNKTATKNGIVDDKCKNQTNKLKKLQSAISQGKAKKRKQKRTASNKENKKVVPYNEFFKAEVVKRKLELEELVKGPIRINPKSCKMAYVSNADRNCQDYIITSIIDRNRALEGDIVVLEVKPESEWVENQKSASVVYIYEKIHPRIAIGSLSAFYDKGRKLVALQPRDKRLPRIVVHQTSLPPMYFKNPSEYEDVLFLAKITDWNHPKYAEGLIVERIGVKNDLHNETLALLFENQLDVTPFPASVCKYLPQQSTIPEIEFSYREDLRKDCIFTIDPLTARDLDDAVSCKSLPNGNLEVGIHIADVSFYLAETTELDEIVARKGTTIYLVDNVYHMLPVELCIHCSLLPGKDCLAFSVFFEMTPDGEILSHRFARTIINSCCQLAYEHAQLMIDNKDEFDEGNLPDIYNGYSPSDLSSIVNKLQRISSNLRCKRFENGALRIDQTKILFKLNANGEPVEFFTYENIEAHRLIEELMLLANITVARRILEDFPKIAFLRCHEPPNPRLMKEVQETLEGVGIHIDISSSGAMHSGLQTYCTPDYFGLARSAVLNHLFAKPMTRARYFCAPFQENFEHFALSVDTYTHFTSPIRRYADIMVHRLLSASLGYSPEPTWDTDCVSEIAANCNKQKYNAKKAGEASLDLFLAYYVEQNQPFVEEAVVIDVREHSFHVMVLKTGSVVRMYLNNLGEGIQYKSEKIGETEKKTCKITVQYPNEKLQMIEIFQIVKVQLRRKGTTFNLEGHLVQPE